MTTKPGEQSEMDEALGLIRAGIQSGASDLTLQVAVYALGRLEALLAGSHQAVSHAGKRPRKKKAAQPTPADGG